MEKIDNERGRSGKSLAFAEVEKSLELVNKLEVNEETFKDVEELKRLLNKALLGLRSDRTGESTMTFGGSCGSSDGTISESSDPPKKKCKHQGKVVSKRRSNQFTFAKKTQTLEDGYVWRKYGQKMIQNNKNPRSYFRCTYKMSRGCEAKRQSQKSEEDETIYHVSYYGDHTCQTNNNPQTQPLLVSFNRSTASPKPFGTPTKKDCDSQLWDEFLSLPGGLSPVEFDLPFFVDYNRDANFGAGVQVEGDFDIMDVLVVDSDRKCDVFPFEDC